MNFDKESKSEDFFSLGGGGGGGGGGGFRPNNKKIVCIHLLCVFIKFIIIIWHRNIFPKIFHYVIMTTIQLFYDHLLLVVLCHPSQEQNVLNIV